MGGCCSDKSCETDALRERQGHVLKVVLAVNAAMFLLESAAGIMAGSTALIADSLDMLGDALVYGFSLYVLSKGARWQAVSALIKGLIMAGFALFVFGEVVYKLFHPIVPVAKAMGAVGALALIANAFCLWLLWRHRSDDINMHSVWLCSRNDIIANTALLLASAGVWITNSGWPDILVGVSISALFFRSALHVTIRSFRRLKNL